MIRHSHLSIVSKFAWDVGPDNKYSVFHYNWGVKINDMMLTYCVSLATLKMFESSSNKVS